MIHVESDNVYLTICIKRWAPYVPATRHKWLSCLLNNSAWYRLEYLSDLSSPFPTSTLRDFKIHFVFYFSWQWWFPRLKIVVLQTSQSPCIQSQYFTSITNRYIVLILLQICKFTFSHIYIPFIHENLFTLFAQFTR